MQQLMQHIINLLLQYQLSQTDVRRHHVTNFVIYAGPNARQSQSPSCSTHPVPEVDSPKRLTGNESKVFFVSASVVVTAHLTFPRLLNTVPPLMKNSLKNLSMVTTYPQ